MENGTIIVGAGHAGTQLAATLRQDGYRAPVTLMGRENELPYHRPPLSKGFLKGAADVAQPLKGEAFYAANDIELLLGTDVAAIDAEAHFVATADGVRRPFDRLVLATGAVARTPHIPGTDLDRVVSIRTIEDSRRLRMLLPEIDDAVIVGGGFIGLEIAATLAALGKKVTVLEVAGRVLGRVVSPVVSDHVMARVRAAGVDIRLTTGVAAIEGEGGKVRAVMTSTDERIAADLVVLGVGVDPDCTLALAAGLACDDGVLVDATLTTSHPDILAIGDCARFDHWHAGRSVRLESVQNATDQARLAARTIMGGREPYRAVPWFWSDIGDMKLQMVGLPFDADRTVVTGMTSDNAFSVYHFSGDRLIAIDSVNRPTDHMMGRRMLAAGFSPTAAEVLNDETAAAFARFTGVSNDTRQRRTQVG
jgi:3-phenylpropionate/trans-cinnamate dioxygenase ferredoxin reductase subunit